MTRPMNDTQNRVREQTRTASNAVRKYVERNEPDKKRILQQTT